MKYFFTFVIVFIYSLRTYCQSCYCSNPTLNLTGKENGPFPKEYKSTKIQSTTFNNLNVRYSATNSIILEPGFVVSNGQIFTASIVSYFSPYGTYFNTNDEGWRVSGDVQNGSSTPSYSSSG